MGRDILKALIATKLTEIAILKGIDFTEAHFKIWTDNILSDYNSGIVTDVKKGFEKLKSEKAYGGLDYAIFLQGAKPDEETGIDKEWLEVLASAKSGGTKPISARAGKALNSLGGMTWLREAKPENIIWQKKEFIQAYKNTPELENINFRCHGLKTNMYLPKEDLSNDAKRLLA